MDAEIIIKIVSGIVAIIVAIIKFKDLSKNSKLILKIDLEILRMLDPDDSNYNLVKSKIDKKVHMIYNLDQDSTFKKPNINDIPNILLNFVVFFFFTWWTIDILNKGINGWALLTSFFAIIGVEGIVNVFSTQKDVKQAEKEVSNNDNSQGM